MKYFQIRTILCAIAILFTFSLSAENFSNAKNDPATCPTFGSSHKNDHSKGAGHKKQKSKIKKGKTAKHCDAY